MPAQTGKSKLFSSLGDKANKSFVKHKSDETKVPGGGRLPPGIENGVAELIDIYVAQYAEGDNKGKDYFRAAGTVVAPASHNGVPCAGRQTSVMEPICDTKKGDGTIVTFDEHLAVVLNHVRLLGVDTDAFDSIGELDGAIEALKEQGPRFLFRTWRMDKRKKGDKRYNEQYDGPNAPEPRTNETWMGLVPEGMEVDAATPESGTVDETATTPADEAPADESNDVNETAADDLGELVAACESDDAKAKKEIERRAVAAGIDAEAVHNAESWEAVGEMIREAEANADAPEPAKEWKPAKGETYGYRPVDKKTNKPQKNWVDVEVTTVNGKNKTVDVKNLDDGKTVYKAVKWDVLKQNG